MVTEDFPKNKDTFINKNILQIKKKAHKWIT